MGAKAIKLGSCDKHPAYCLDLNVDVWHMRNVINVLVYFKPGEQIEIDAFFSVSDTGILRKPCLMALASTSLL